MNLFEKCEDIYCEIVSKSLYRDILKKKVIPNFRKVKFEEVKNEYDFSLKQKDVEYPYSITMEEGLFMLKTILKNNLKNGYEIATAFGISSFFIGLGFKKTGGLLKTMDCYIEESKNDFIYSAEEIKNHIEVLNMQIEKGKYPTGLKIAKENAKFIKIENNVNYIVGVSPSDAEKYLSDDKLDFVFIDGGHFGNQPTIDFESVKEKIGEKCALFFHDNNQNPAVASAINAAESYFGVKAIDLNTHWHLTILPIGINRL